MNVTDMKEYLKVYWGYLERVEPPQVLVYLRTSTPTLLERIHRRGRDFEQSIGAEYLETLTGFYDALVADLGTVMPKTKIIACETDRMSAVEVLEVVLRELAMLGIAP